MDPQLKRYLCSSEIPNEIIAVMEEYLLGNAKRCSALIAANCAYFYDEEQDETNIKVGDRHYRYVCCDWCTGVMTDMDVDKKNIISSYCDCIYELYYTVDEISRTYNRGDGVFVIDNRIDTGYLVMQHEELEEVKALYEKELNINFAIVSPRWTLFEGKFTNILYNSKKKAGIVFETGNETRDNFIMGKCKEKNIKALLTSRFSWDGVITLDSFKEYLNWGWNLYGNPHWI
ncbi:hypothetical protein BNJ_00255 [Kaumoebavirus]|uniref:hypothetical protein n=1 Tax=Kaumoebavirus TaxID=1859492 RepID=UPI0009C1B60E|nr:hypothetical protein BNJ_00255 [Kaumoebavirus]ARA72081.1 hypothetical protein BNJ_00255 [Kaumoebavirus]